MNRENLSTLAHSLTRKLVPDGMTDFRGSCSGLGYHEGGKDPPSGHFSQKGRAVMERHSVHNLTISKRGITFIKRWEDCRLAAYKDGGGVWTIGFGHTGHVLPGLVINYQQAEDLLRSDLNVAERVIRHAVEVPLSQNEYDALSSFIFNIGSTQFFGSTLRARLNNCEYDQAADQFPRWCYDNGKLVKGLQNRRRDERLLFTGHYSQ